jgi:hypothetical protein
MSVKTLHPALTANRLAEWQRMRDCMDGEAQVKSQNERYLPMPSGFKGQPDAGKAMYDAYKNRAQFPAILAPSVAAMIGIIHGREIKVEMPDAMQFLWESADGHGLPLEAFHRRITRELLVIGGYAVLADAPESGGEPYLVGFPRDLLINWDVDFWVLDETRDVRDGFAWQQLEQYRLLMMGGAFYTPFLFRGNVDAGEEIQVRGRGGALLPRIPFAVGNAMDLSPRVEAPPLIGVANAAIAIYQLSADYRHQLYMSGQETLVAINGQAPTMVGAGAVHEMQGGDGLTPDLKYVSPSCTGIEAHKIAMVDQREAAVMAGARLFEQAQGVQESGEARKLRFASETATLTSIAQSSCLLLEKSLRNVAMIMGLPEDEIVVIPPADLLDQTMSPQDFAALFGVYREGGMSWDSYFAAGQRGGLFSPEVTAEEEFGRLDNSDDLGDNAL